MMKYPMRACEKLPSTSIIPKNIHEIIKEGKLISMRMKIHRAKYTHNDIAIRDILLSNDKGIQKRFYYCTHCGIFSLDFDTNKPDSMSIFLFFYILQTTIDLWESTDFVMNLVFCYLLWLHFRFNVISYVQ
eukprot:436414_1